MIYLFFADGFEEIEAIAPLDLLRRADKEVITIGVGKKEIISSRGLKIITDIEETEIKLNSNLEMIILPGGMPGTENLFNCGKVREAVNFCADNDIYIGAICAAPSIPGRMGLLKGKSAVCYPGHEDKLEGALVSGESVVCDGKIITAKGAGVSLQFSLKLVEVLCGIEKANSLSEVLQCE